MSAGSISPQASAFYRSAIVWDNHGCLPFDNLDRWVGELVRYHFAGVSVVSINIADAETPLETLIHVASRLRSFVGDNPDKYLLASKPSDIESAKREGKLAIVFDVEGIFSLGDRLDLVQFYYDIGVRWMLFVYNRKNLAGFGCHDELDGGLTPFGRNLVREMDRVGIVKCCSHTGYRTAMDVFSETDRPTIFSHSNPRALWDHPRNIPDELIDACAKSGGVVCINGVGIFLGDNDIRIATFVDHVDYVVQRVGAESAGIGLDYVFDQEGLTRLLAAGANTWPQGYGYRPGVKFLPPEELPRITDELQRRGYDDNAVRAILGGNLLRVARRIWR